MPFCVWFLILRCLTNCRPFGLFGDDNVFSFPLLLSLLLLLLFLFLFTFETFYVFIFQSVRKTAITTRVLLFVCEMIYLCLSQTIIIGMASSIKETRSTKLIMNHCLGTKVLNHQWVMHSIYFCFLLSSQHKGTLSHPNLIAGHICA